MQVSKRRLLTVLGATAVGTASLTNLSDSAQAQVSMGNLSIPDTEKGTTGSVNDITISVTGKYSVSISTDIDEIIMRIVAGTKKDTLHVVHGTRINPSEKTATGTETIQTSLLNARGISKPMFEVQTPGESLTQTVYIGLELDIKSNGAVLATDSVTTDVDLTVTNETVTINSELGGTGRVKIKT